MAAPRRSHRVGEFISFREFNARPTTTGGRVFQGVTLIKAGLGNRKDRHFYPDHVLKEAVDAGQFDDLKMFVDHPTSVDDEIQPERTVRDFAGLYTKPRFIEGRNGRGGRVVANLRIFKSNQWLADNVNELVEMGQSDKIGLSINGHGQTEKVDLQEAGETLQVNRLTKFAKINSADVVTEAGAGGGFQQLLESARGAFKERGMDKAALHKKLNAAVKEGKYTLVEALAKQLRECDMPTGKRKKAMESDGTADAGAGAADAGADGTADAAAQAARDAAGAGGKKTKQVATRTEDVDADTDPDDEDAVDEPDLDETFSRHAASADPDDEDDPDEDDDEDAVDDEDEDDVEEADEDAEPTREATAGKINGWSGKKTNPFVSSAGKVPKGMKSKGGPGMTVTGKRKKRKGQRFGEADREGREMGKLQREVTHLRGRNIKLAEALKQHQKAAAARKILKEAKVPADLATDMIPKLMECTSPEAMRSEVGFYMKLRESAISTVREEFDGFSFDEVEGAGGRARESGFGATDSEDVFTGVLRESGLPMKQRRDA